MTMQLQVALDRMPMERAVELTRLVAIHADWVEVGTSLIKRFGMAAISAVVDAAGDVPVLADTKTVDDGVTEVAMCSDAGARATTVLAVADSSTVHACVDAARQRDAELVIDLLASSTRRRDDLLRALGGVEHVVWAAHVGKDSLAQGGQAVGAHVLGPWATGLRMALAGGLTVEHVGGLARDWPAMRLVVGSAVTAAADPLQAILELRTAISRWLPDSQAVVTAEELP
jgi:3-hexulose-6-phosphate synthase